MSEYYVYVEYEEHDMSNCLLNFTTLEGAKSWMLNNFKNHNKMRLLEGAEIHFMYQEQIHITNRKVENNSGKQ